MVNAFETAIRPLSLRLDELLGVKHIKVRSFDYDEPVTVQIKEDGLVSHCNHAGAEFGIFPQDYQYGDSRTGEVSMGEVLVQGTLCDRCPAWMDMEGEWHE